MSRALAISGHEKGPKPVKARGHRRSLSLPVNTWVANVFTFTVSVLSYAVFEAVTDPAVCIVILNNAIDARVISIATVVSFDDIGYAFVYCRHCVLLT